MHHPTTPTTTTSVLLLETVLDIIRAQWTKQALRAPQSTTQTAAALAARRQPARCLRRAADSAQSNVPQAPAHRASAAAPPAAR
eukprot:2911611-Prymnesium_polylepis.1